MQNITTNTVEQYPLLDIHEATLVRGTTCILDKLNLRIEEGQHTAILGPNGSGKSSLIKLITRQHYPLARDDGKPSVSIFGKHLWNVFELRTLLGIVSSDLHQNFIGDGRIYGLEGVLSGFFASQGLAQHHTITADMHAKAQEALAQVEALPLADRRLETMSTGEARRILIARALVNQPRALVLDEPTAGLDLIARRRFLETLRRIAQNGTTLIFVTHHIEEILPEVGRVVMMKEGQVFRDGPTQKMLTSEHLSSLFGGKIVVRHEAGYYSAEATRLE